MDLAELLPLLQKHNVRHYDDGSLKLDLDPVVEKTDPVQDMINLTKSLPQDVQHNLAMTNDALMSGDKILEWSSPNAGEAGLPLVDDSPLEG